VLRTFIATGGCSRSDALAKRRSCWTPGRRLRPACATPRQGDATLRAWYDEYAASAPYLVDGG